MTSATTTMSAPSVRERILGAAVRRFYAEGVRSVSADRIIADAGISKVTFYRHFRTKDDLVVAYLEHAQAAEREQLAAARAAHPGDPAGVLRWYAESLGDASCSPEFRGCAFINAAAEYPDRTHPVRVVVDTRREWLTGQAVELLEEMGVADAPARAEQLMMLRDGAMVAGALGRSPKSVAAAVLAAGRAILRP